MVPSADDTEGEGVELTPVSTNRFVISGTRVLVEFVPAANGRPQETRVTGMGSKPVVSQKLDTFALSGGELHAFAGEYTSPELDITYTIAARDSGLVVQMPGGADVVLRPIFPDAFAGAGFSVVKFSRDARGAVTGFTVNTSSVRGLHFDRVKR